MCNYQLYKKKTRIISHNHDKPQCYESVKPTFFKSECTQFHAIPKFKIYDGSIPQQNRQQQKTQTTSTVSLFQNLSSTETFTVTEK